MRVLLRRGFLSGREPHARPRFEQELRQAGISWDQWTNFCQARHLDCFADVDKAQRAKLDGVDTSAIVVDDAIAGEITGRRAGFSR
jgi:hypothetical protein